MALGWNLKTKEQTMNFETVAKAWINAFNEKNLSQLLALYADNAEHLSPKLRQKRPETGGVIRGKNELKQWWADAFVNLPTLHYQLERLTVGKSHIFIEYTRQLEGELDLDVAEILEFENGLICHSRVYHG